MSADVLLKMQGICKSFSGVTALDNVDFTVRKNEVHALMGENGAGKSTLIKVLSGLYKMDSGTITLADKEYYPTSPSFAQEMGISTIFQEINLQQYLSIAENIFLGHEPKNRGIVDWQTMNQKAKQILNEIGIDIDVTKILGEQNTAIHQMTAIARAISFDTTKIVVMDEPTSSLDDAEVQMLFKIIRNLKNKGVSVIYISHKLNEIYEVCDRITVLRDGKLIGEHLTGELPKVELVSMMIGKDSKFLEKRIKKEKDFSDSEIICEVKNVRSGNKLNGVDLAVRRGEIVGLSGLLGSGRTELAKVLFGADTGYTGEVLIKGKPVKYKIQQNAIEDGIAFCSEDRKIEGIFPEMSIETNLVIADIDDFSRKGWISRKKCREVTEEYIEKFSIKTPSKNQLIKNLSGGNQQKVLLARWLCMGPELIILDEPTRGIDIGAKSEIESLIQNMASNGISVLWISSEVEELVRGCDRIAVLSQGKKVKELQGDEISIENVFAAMALDNENISLEEAE